MCNNVLRAFCLILCLSFTATVLRAELSILNVLAPTAAKCDGEIEVLAEGTAGPFTVSISGYGRPDQVEFSGVNGAVVFNNLCGGDYTITIINALGCELELQTYLERCVIELFPLEIMLPTNPSSTDGKLVVAPLEEGDFFYEWNTGQVGNTLVDLAPGDYTVTVSKNDRCSQVQTFTMEACLTSGEVENPIPPDFDIALKGGLGFEDNDFIECQVLLREEGSTIFTENISSDYSVDWFLDGNLIASGQSTVMVDKELAFDPQVAPEITVKISNGCMSKMLSKVLYICGGVDLYDARGFFIRSIENACEGGKGGITIEIPNPNQEYVTVEIDEIRSYFSGVSEDEMVLNLEGIEVGRHMLHINIGGCENSIEFSIERETNRRELIRYEDLTCFFNEYCGDIPLAGELQSPVDFDFNNATNAPCAIPLLCDGEFVGQKSYGIKKIRAAAYKHLVNLVVNGMTNYPIDFGIAAQLHARYEEIDPCGFVSYCPATLAIRRTDGAFYHGRRVNSVIVNGCEVMNCSVSGIPTIVTICSDNLGAPSEFLLQEPPSFRTCDQITMNFFEAIKAWENGEFSHIANFQDTDLYNKLQMNQGRQEAYCATIGFCAADLTVVYNDIDEVNCNAVSNYFCICESYPEQDVGNQYTYCYNEPELGPCTPFPTTTTYHPQTGEILYEDVICRKDNPTDDDCYTRVVIDHNPIIDWPTGYGPTLRAPEEEWRHKHKYYVNHREKEKLQNFGLFIQDGKKSPIGLIKGSDGSYLEQDYSYRGNTIQRIATVAENWSIIDWDHSQEIYVENVAINHKDRLIYIEDSLHWTKDIRANRYLEISHLSKTESSIWVGGLFKGYLAIDKTSVEHVSNPSAFLMEVDYNGVVKEIEVIQGIDTSSLVKFEEMGENGIVLAGRYQEGGLVINSRNIPMQEDAGIFLLHKKKEEGFQRLLDIPSSPTFEFIDLAVASSNERFTLAINGQKEALGKTDEIAASLGNGITLLTVDVKGELIWSTSTESSALDVTHLDLTYGRDRDDLFLGLTFYDQLHWQGQDLSSKGEDDIALLKWDADGELQWAKSYGTRDSENVSQLLFEENTLFFGGEFSGAEVRREIGEYEFINPFAPEAKVYMSYVLDEDTRLGNTTKAIAGLDLTSKSFNFHAYPNPFEDVLYLEIQGADNQEVLIELQDLLGRTFVTRNYNMVVGKQNITLKLANDFPDGVYQIRITPVDKIGTEEPQIEKLIHVSR